LNSARVEHAPSLLRHRTSSGSFLWAASSSWGRYQISSDQPLRPGQPILAIARKIRQETQ
jgi:hypothetical protein